MFTRFFTKFCTKLTSRLSFKASINTSLFSKTKSSPIVFLFSNSSKFTFSTSFLSNSQIQIAPDLVKNINQVVPKVPWSETISTLTFVVENATSINQPEIEDLFATIDSKFVSGGHLHIAPSELIDLTFVFGTQSRGSDKFWDQILDNFSNCFDENAFTIEQLASFIYAFTRQYSIDFEFWEAIERKILNDGPQNVSARAVALLIPAYHRTYSQRFGNQHVEYNGKLPDNFVELKSTSLWTILIELAIKKLPNMDTYALFALGTALTGSDSKSDGFWLAFEERFNELSFKLQSREIATIASVFGGANRGSSEFWDNIETYVTGTIDLLHPEEVHSFIQGFGNANQGSMRLWELLQNYFLTNNEEFGARGLSKVALGFASTNVGKSKLWTVLEDRLVLTMKDLDCEGLLNTIRAFNIANKGDELFWERVEEKVLEFDQLNPGEKMILYVELKNANKVGPKLASHFNDVAEVGNRYTQDANEENNRDTEEGLEAKQ